LDDAFEEGINFLGIKGKEKAAVGEVMDLFEIVRPLFFF
jgi:hypothetical protein